MRKADFVSEARQAARQLWEAINTLKAMQREWNALDYGTTLDDEGDTAFIGEHEGLTPAAVGAVVFDTANAVEGVLNAGHATNLAKLL